MITTASLGRALAEQAGATWANRDYDQGFYDRQAAKALARAAELDEPASQEDGDKVATTEAIRALLDLPAHWEPARVLDAARWWISANVRPDPGTILAAWRQVCRIVDPTDGFLSPASIVDRVAVTFTAFERQWGEQ